MKAVTFDLWDTLIHLEDDDRLIYQEKREMLADALITNGEKIGVDNILLNDNSTSMNPKLAYRKAQAIAAKKAGSGLTMTPSEQLRLAGEMMGRLPNNNEFLYALSEIVAQLPIKITPDALKTLDYIKEMGLKTAVISNTIDEPGRILAPICERLGLGERIDLWKFSDESSYAKPSPQIFRETYRSLGVIASDTIHVGDALTDVVGSKRAGCWESILFTHFRKLPTLTGAFKEAFELVFYPVQLQMKRSVRTRIRHSAWYLSDWVGRWYLPDHAIDNLELLLQILR